MKNTQAFTLIELLVVVLIIGILAAVALPQYNKAVVKSRLANLKTLVHTMSNAQQIYHLANNTYTQDVDALHIDLPSAQEVISGTSTIFSYPWGYCTLSMVNFGCANTNVGIMYMITFESGLKQCGAVQTNSISNQVCKQETGHSSVDWSGVGWHAYNYQ